MDDLVESILDYVRSDYTDYAIMINGEWGSGKTYFWNNQIKKKIESMTLNGRRYKTIYMSLYGISNLEEISKKIFIETTQLMDKSLKKYMNSHERTAIPEYAKTGLDMANFFGVASNGDKIDYEEFFSTNDKVLCFDDLERANVDVIDILGYINNFVEHDHIKTIIICNEKELATKMKSENLEMKTFIATYLLDKQGELNKNDVPMIEKIKDRIETVFERANEYERIKEKLIGETFEYAPQFDYIINGILMRYESNKGLIKFLRENAMVIMTTFKRSGTRNLRILKQALNDFKKIYEMIDKYYPNTNKVVMQTILIFTIAVSFEIKAGKITKEKFKNIEDNEEYKAILVSSKVLNDNRQFYIKEFDNNYYYNFKADYRFFKFIEYYVRTRIFDMKIFKVDMEEAERTFSGEKEVPAYKKILTEEYWKIPDNKFFDIVYEALEDIKSGKLELIDIVKLYVYYVYFVKNNLLSYDMEELKKDFMSGMRLSLVHSRYCKNIEQELEKVTVMNATEEMDDIIKEFNNLNSQLLEKEYKSIAEDIFKCIPMKMEQFYERFDKECMSIPMFKYYDPYQMFQRISCATNEDIVIIKERLLKRAELYPEIAEQESKNMKGLKQIIDDYLKGKDSTIKTVILKGFSKDLAKLIK
ncbi:MAG: hypothetical protein HFJ17_04640 [Clostridia bacterium]|nr:hypothetical protein [Clostridia bacterium]